MISVVIPPKAAAVGFIPAGMDKSGTQSHNVAGGYMQVTGWASRSGWTNGPTGNTLVATAGGVAILSGSLNLGTGFVQKGVQIKKNGSVIYTHTVTTTSSPLVFAVHTNASAGDVFTMESYCSISTETIQTANTYLTMKIQEFAFTATHTDDFNRADNTTLGSPWAAAAALATPDVVSNRAIGTNDANCRTGYIASPQATRPNTFVKATIAGIGSNHVGITYATDSDSAKSTCYAALTSATNLQLGRNTSTSSSNTGTLDSNVTVPTVSVGTEILAMHTSAISVDIFLNRVYVATHMHSLAGVYNGLFVSNTTDIIDDWSQGTWT
ncbi:hypothetical protein [Rhodococcus opacus]|uniref:Uncharacterized protein n=1 Tax=Rhodococcus opacus TaxID=37919 RepID=A0A2S8JB17_RHOOP|nr:hypothetical protein [Rhodococcus opacus]PQP24180.1 hypothetical protein C5613_14970 [Rhodococcus opacus]